MPIITPEDLAPFADIDQAKAEAMIADATAMARRVAPCIDDPESDIIDAVKAILRGAILRWNDAGSGALSSTQQSAGPYSQSTSFDTRQVRRNLFWPSEIDALKELCSKGNEGAFAVDTAPTSGIVVHADICSLRFGGEYCSCGAILTGRLPLYEW